jgi:hypothetical protein
MTDPILEDLRTLRRLQKQFFASKERDLLEQIRPLETSLLPRLEGLTRRPSHIVSLEALEVYRSGLKMIQYQQAWITAKNRAKSLEKLNMTSDTLEAARKKTSELEASAKDCERTLDQQIARYLSPKLPGF